MGVIRDYGSIIRHTKHDPEPFSENFHTPHTPHCFLAVILPCSSVARPEAGGDVVAQREHRQLQRLERRSDVFVLGIGEDGAGAASRGDALDEEAADEFEDDEEEWLDIDAEDGWPAELR